MYSLLVGCPWETMNIFEMCQYLNTYWLASVNHFRADALILAAAASFTENLRQERWLLDPMPTCSECCKALEMVVAGTRIGRPRQQSWM